MFHISLPQSRSDDIYKWFAACALFGTVPRSDLKACRCCLWDDRYDYIEFHLTGLARGDCVLDNTACTAGSVSGPTPVVIILLQCHPEVVMNLVQHQ